MVYQVFKILKSKIRPKRKESHMAQAEVINNKIYLNGQPLPKVTSKVKKYSEGQNTCEYIIFHYTASSTLSSAHNSFLNPETKASWHLTVDRDGTVYQLYDFRKITWHAGKSSWLKQEGMNSRSIGIEIINAGPLNFKNGSYYTWSGQMLALNEVFFDGNGNPWHKYTDAQLSVCQAIAKVLTKEYKCKDILSHEMVSPGRKQDTGPAFQNTLNIMRNNLRRV
jgi:N-acetylmuramoyl-L-alanine amidase